MNKKFLPISITIVTLFSISLFGAVFARPFYKDISVEKAQRMILSDGHHDLVVIDIRPAFMFVPAHIPGAINLPVIEFSVFPPPPPPTLNWEVFDTWIDNGGQTHLNDKIIIHCIAGLASVEAAQRLADAGFKKVNSIEGGFTAWDAAGYPTEP